MRFCPQMFLAVSLACLFVTNIQCETMREANLYKVTPHQDWKNELRPNTSAQAYSLAPDGNPVRIVIPEKPNAQEQKAAEDLGFWMFQALGLKLPIVRESPGLSYKSGDISVGSTRLSDAKGLPKVDLANEGYQIDVKDGHLFLQGGRDRGPIFAVYALLEEDLGLRWFPRLNDGDRQVTVSLPPRLKDSAEVELAPRTYLPPFSFRSVYLYDNLKSPEVAYLNRLNATEHHPESYGPTFRFPPDYFVHTYKKLVPQEEYFSKYPEYFALIDGKRDPRQICPMNPKVREIVVKKADIILSESNYNSISISPNDYKELCDCPICNRINTENHSTGAANLDLTNHVANALAKKYPKANFWTLAYWGTIDCPTKVRPAANVVIFLCDDKHSPLYPFHFIPQTHDFEKIALAWMKAASRIYIWEYVANFSHYLLPFPNTEPVAENMRWFREHGVGGGVMLQGAFQGQGNERAELRTWLWAKQLWNPDWKTDDLERDFSYAYYGPAAPHMAAYNSALQEKWRELHAQKVEGRGGAGDINDLSVSAHFHPNVFWMTDEFLANLEKHLSAAKVAAKGDAELSNRIDVASLSVLYARLGKYLGYQLKYGEVVPGARERSDVATRRIEFPLYQAMFDRFVEITRKNNVDFISEWTSANRDVRIDRWKRVLGRDALKADFRDISNGFTFRTDPDGRGEREQWYATSWPKSATIDTKPTDKGVNAWATADIIVDSSFDRRGKLALLIPDGVTADIYVDGKKVADLGRLEDGEARVLDLRSVVEPGQTIRIVVHSKGGLEFLKPGNFLLVSLDGDPTSSELVSAGKAATSTH